jgi:cytochrome b6-f complex subunit 4
MTVPEKHDEKADDSIPFFPDHATTELYVAAGVMAIVFIVGIVGQLWPVGLDEPADPMNTPLHTKPEWYFLFLYQMLKYVPKTAGALIPIVGILLLVVWPFIDRKSGDTVRARRLRIAGVVLFFVAALALTILGEIS